MRQALAMAAKAPRPGTVKTRLQSFLSAEDATELYRCFLKDTMALMDSMPDTDPVISYTPIGSEKYFEGVIAGRHRLLPQRGPNFGQRLHYALEDLLGEGYQSVAIMNSDSPTLPAGHLRLAFEKLNLPGSRVVLGPACDGGYYLIGIKESEPRLFEDISWSTDLVLKQTVDRANAIGLDVELLPRWYDVDDEEGFERLGFDLGCVASTRLALKRDCRGPAGGPPRSPDGLGQGPDENAPGLAPNTRRFLRQRWSVKSAHAYD
jgi:rSAM/selenodomain-associated transferase 1